jgi:hypothetical protein
MSKLFKISDFRPFSNTFIETGACMGAGIDRALQAGFTRVKSVELDEKLYTHCIRKFKNKPVELFKGKSTDQLHIMLADVYETAVIFLDAHPAGPNTAGHEEWLKGDTSVHQNNIIRQELEIILDHPKKHIIIIDDMTPEDALPFMDMLEGYTFEFLDEQLESGNRVENKVLVCKPS